MSALLDEVKQYVGVECEPLVYSMDAGAIRFFAEALMDPDRLYRDEDYAMTTQHGRIVAPPTFYARQTEVESQ